MYIPNAFIQTRIEDEKYMAIIKIRGFLVDIILDITPDVYVPCVIMDRKDVNQLIFQCQDTIYGTITASLLYYKKFKKSLEDEGRKLNPYDPCVANKITKGSPMTVCFHIYNFKLIHKIPKVVGY